MNASTQTNAADKLWTLILAASRLGRSRALDLEVAAGYALGDGQEPALKPLRDQQGRAAIEWLPRTGWQLSDTTTEEPMRSLAELYLPLCNPLNNSSMVFAHLGQSIDSCVATACGDSCYVTGEENLRHLHRMRALSDAVLVGTETAACDNPKLTTRLVEGKNAIRVILDRRRRLPPGLGVFTDTDAETWLVCDHDQLDAPGSVPARGRLIGLPTRDGHLDLVSLIERLAELGIQRLFIEGGGATVSAFVAEGLVDRLQVAIAPLLIGAGRVGLSPPASDLLRNAIYPSCRLYRMGRDILYDMDMRRPQDGRTDQPPTGLERIA
ncbi:MULTISPECIES: RibD family protein [Thiorhodovibrio]|uniref:RibD family protein n=1 Tax=Thiorhodovibrio TaxID=61593 RepID=UPI001913799B|nr:MULTISPECIES: RibD family protein [Thiorhodovibrio]MBK5969262.1 deaminase [Thiorhodovibrio winogradskyi]WPL11253.1 Riboflavin biosynthesis protein RibD [Thiorhodovibrio litoralis]